MTKAITVRVDDEIKRQAEELLHEMGLNMSTYINSSLKALTREKRVPFELTTIQRSNEEYITKLDMSIAESERGEVVTYTMDELRAMVEDE